ncbi:pantetheine-phosphate adenylyltransferase [Butyricicoccus porcorum]|uniref:Phosphopantetheine adenylyltransferase n=1 Tax=Butyricicoccus porcorum TaxID=1945634 RepID=A0A252F5H6_9FIRM|nr:pantetheine-phosphate adenylyltransferase [Butyricicoccus porcorum]MCI6927241.1 pantetheine-phosphate adenylyltransferase [Butyricicoccus porcorum]MDD6986804.1 pantetheine-phosphate adenylyltransferase [Butyricicoccus porcorum]MDY4482802.1 pantetheine-phosphate adenylyltransferase [Butyricicoccus porcorum]OUM21019.1 pantetheine-phosphate adenylyltransferase [Butyricicoccus porcorum]
MRIGVYPGSFDPATLGHLDIIQRASRLFDKLIVAPMINGEKHSSFTMEEKVDFLRRMTRDLPNVEVESFGGLLADYVKEKNACAIVKGLRAVSDFEYEFQMALANKKLNPDVDTVFLMTGQKYLFLSSTIVRDIARHGGDITGFVPEEIRDDIMKKLDRTR